MTEIANWGLLGAAFALGTVLGGLITVRVMQARFDVKLENAGVELTKRHAVATNELRAAHMRAQGEVEQMRTSFKRQLVAAAEGPRAAVQRAEERLQAAYAELDRMRAASSRAQPAGTHGFAPTEVLE